MQSRAQSPEQYVAELPEDRIDPINKLRDVIKANLPKEYEEIITYGMLAYPVPLKVFPDGYHSKKEEPLPFISLASQKNYISLYHMALYGDSEILMWFEQEWYKHSEKKLDMGKCCIRFKKMDDIPYELIGKLVSKMNFKEWISIYTKALKKVNKN